MLTYYKTKVESDSVALIFVERMQLMKNQGAAHRNIFCVTVQTLRIQINKRRISKRGLYTQITLVTTLSQC